MIDGEEVFRAIREAYTQQELAALEEHLDTLTRQLCDGEEAHFHPLFSIEPLPTVRSPYCVNCGRHVFAHIDDAEEFA